MWNCTLLSVDARQSPCSPARPYLGTSYVTAPLTTAPSAAAAALSQAHCRFATQPTLLHPKTCGPLHPLPSCALICQAQWADCSPPCAPHPATRAHHIGPNITAAIPPSANQQIRGLRLKPCLCHPLPCIHHPPDTDPGIHMHNSPAGMPCPVSTHLHRLSIHRPRHIANRQRTVQQPCLLQLLHIRRPLRLHGGQ